MSAPAALCEGFRRSASKVRRYWRSYRAKEKARRYSAVAMSELLATMLLWAEERITDEEAERFLGVDEIDKVYEAALESVAETFDTEMKQ